MDVYLARQPILSSDRRLVGFELLYRDSEKNAYSLGIDGNQSTRAVISEALFAFDLDRLTKGKPAFVNFTKDLLMQRVPMLLKPQNFSIEILEDVELNSQMIERLTELKQAGYTLVLDDYIGNSIPMEALLLIDIVKVDFRQTDKAKRKSIARELLRLKKCLLAEKVESLQEFQEAIMFGYQLFQGYYFSAPVMLKQNAMDIATISYMKLMHELSLSELNFDKIAAIIYPDVHLTYKLLKKMHTAQYYRGHTVTSIKLALVHMGMDEVRRWGMLLLMRQVIGEGMDELVRVGLIRAVFCECLAEKMENGMGTVAFSVGMFSIIANEDAAFYEILDGLHMADVIKGALVGENWLGDLLCLVKIYEIGDWEKTNTFVKKKFPLIKTGDLSPAYLAAINYADSVWGESEV